MFHRQYIHSLIPPKLCGAHGSSGAKHHGSWYTQIIYNVIYDLFEEGEEVELQRHMRQTVVEK
jgi:hypothetical protein